MVAVQGRQRNVQKKRDACAVLLTKPIAFDVAVAVAVPLKTKLIIINYNLHDKKPIYK